MFTFVAIVTSFLVGALSTSYYLEEPLWDFVKDVAESLWRKVWPKS